MIIAFSGLDKQTAAALSVAKLAGILFELMIKRILTKHAPCLGATPLLAVSCQAGHCLRRMHAMQGAVLVQPGHTLLIKDLLPYSLVASWAGNAQRAPASGSVPFYVRGTCFIVNLSIASYS